MSDQIYTIKDVIKARKARQKKADDYEAKNIIGKMLFTFERGIAASMKELATTDNDRNDVLAYASFHCDNARILALYKKEAFETSYFLISGVRALATKYGLKNVTITAGLEPQWYEDDMCKSGDCWTYSADYTLKAELDI